MGGDLGPQPIIEGIFDALKEHEFIAQIVGKKEEITPFIPSGFEGKYELVEASDVIPMSAQATDALKRKESTVYVCTEMVKNKKSDALVSAGHSGATMSLATLRLGRIKGISRPAICTIMPQVGGGNTLVLDVGANVDCRSEHLYQFGMMGYEYAKYVMKKSNPKIGLLSNGEEESKGNDINKESFVLLKNLESFIGNVEGNNIFDGSVDVVVCDGFVGNVMLKTSEGVAESITKILKNEIKKSFFAKIGAMLMIGAFKRLKKVVDYAEYGGAPLLGVDGNVIICHGKSNAKAIKNAIVQAIKLCNANLKAHIAHDVQEIKEN